MAKINAFRAEIYTVGWLCALPIELAAAQGMLDDEHRTTSFPSDTNKYTCILGRIGECNVVIACLPIGEPGNIEIVKLCKDMKFQFPAIIHWLLVGVGGGVPSPKDIRLGDVVVSSPSGKYGGVVQYDFGKIHPLGRLEDTACPKLSSQGLRSTASILRANCLQTKSKFLENASRLDSLPEFEREKAGADYLFPANYHHPEEGIPSDTSVTCMTNGICSEQLHKIIVRRPREPRDRVLVHYGTIASGNWVVRDGETRDKINTRFGSNILCYDMEAAGFMSCFNGLVIRGICDYADSHKNKFWQPYAAKMAAAYARELVSLIPTEGSAERVSENRAIGNSKTAALKSEVSRSLRRKRSNNEERIYCFSCGRLGVKAPACGCLQRGQIHCFICKRPDVIAPYCKCRDECYECNERGHWREECPLMHKRYKPHDYISEYRPSFYGRFRYQY